MLKRSIFLETKINNFNDEGIPTFYSHTQSYVPKIPVPTKIDILQTSLAAYKKYKEYKRENGKPDIIHAHSVIWGGVEKILYMKNFILNTL